MKHISYASVTFDAGHATTSPLACEKPHGHAVTITVGIQDKPNKDFGSYTTDVGGLVTQLRLVRSELTLRSLNDMIAPSMPTAAGLALWTWERLAMQYAETLYSVKVEMAGLAHEVTA